MAALEEMLDGACLTDDIKAAGQFDTNHGKELPGMAELKRL